MSKITFRADEELVERLEAFDASKSEVMREALRRYLDAEVPDSQPTGDPSDTLDDALAARVNELVERKVAETLSPATRSAGRRVPSTPRAHDINVDITVDGIDGGPVVPGPASNERATEDIGDPTPEDARLADERNVTPTGGASQGDDRGCSQCGAELDDDHVYCPNCGEKASSRAFCECGDEVRTDWSFCPGCGRRTPAADVLNNP